MNTLAIGFEGISVLEDNHKSYLSWRYSTEEFYHVKMMITDKISFILKVLMNHGKIDNKDRTIVVAINISFDKVLILIDPVSLYDESEVLLATSQVFHSSYGGWKEGNVDFNTIKITDKKYFLVTRVISIKYT